MKSTEQKRKEAFTRLSRTASYDNSKAKRKGTMTKEEWTTRQNKLIADYKTKWGYKP